MMISDWFSGEIEDTPYYDVRADIGHDIDGVPEGGKKTNNKLLSNNYIGYTN